MATRSRPHTSGQIVGQEIPRVERARSSRSGVDGGGGIIEGSHDTQGLRMPAPTCLEATPPHNHPQDQGAQYPSPPPREDDRRESDLEQGQRGNHPSDDQEVCPTTQLEHRSRQMARLLVYGPVPAVFFMGAAIPLDGM